MHPDCSYAQGSDILDISINPVADKSRSAGYAMPRKRSLKPLLIVCLLLILAIGGVMFYLFQSLLIPVGYSSEELIGQQYETVQRDLEQSGFSDVRTEEVADLPIDRISEVGMVTDIKIGSESSFDATSRYRSDLPVEITYHSLKYLTVPLSPKDAKGMNYEVVTKSFNDAGFENVTYEVKYDLITGWLTDAGEVESVSINGDEKFSTDNTYRADAEVVITYHEFRKHKPK